jgi:hypothetical protein
MTKPGAHMDPRLKEWATPTQAKYLDHLNETGGLRAAARAAGVSHDIVRRSLLGLKAHAAKQGYSPEHAMTKPVPDGYIVKGVSTYYDKEGNPAGQWVKSAVDAARQAEMFKAAAEAMAEDIPRLAPLAKPLVTNADLCNVYTITDYHAGMLAAKTETQDADWDLKIAERTLTGCFEQMIASTPMARTGIVNQLGDFLHYDSLSAVTPQHGHLLDADGRYSKLVSAAIRMLRTIIDMALARHEVVHVVMAEGNHDMASSVWLRHMFAALYEKEPRITVDTTALPYYVYQHGETMLAFHHGHLSKNAQLPLLFASQYPAMWGLTKKRYAHAGHRHHTEEKEHPGMKVVQHPTLAARDAYAARGGWISEREATAMTYHIKYGLVARNTVTPEMLDA